MLGGRNAVYFCTSSDSYTTILIVFTNSKDTFSLNMLGKYVVSSITGVIISLSLISLGFKYKDEIKNSKSS